MYSIWKYCQSWYQITFASGYICAVKPGALAVHSDWTTRGTVISEDEV
jgi:hypothetical protein